MTGRGLPSQSRPESRPGPAQPLEKPHADTAVAEIYRHPWAAHEKEGLQNHLEEQNPHPLREQRNVDPRPSRPEPQSRRRKPGGEVERRMHGMHVNATEIETER